MSFEQILVPVDFSETADVALRYGSDLANMFGATLHVLHVVETVAPGGGGVSGTHHTTASAALIAPIEHVAYDELKMALANVQPQPGKSALAITEGSPFVEIVRYTRDHDIDLIVMGTHGRGPVAHMLLGSVADNVIRSAPCPVLTVRHPKHALIAF